MPEYTRAVTCWLSCGIGLCICYTTTTHELHFQFSCTANNQQQQASYCTTFGSQLRVTNTGPPEAICGWSGLVSIIRARSARQNFVPSSQEALFLHFRFKLGVILSLCSLLQDH